MKIRVMLLKNSICVHIWIANHITFKHQDQINFHGIELVYILLHLCEIQHFGTEGTKCNVFGAINFTSEFLMSLQIAFEPL
jgi:hypothetical protein